MPEHEIKGHRFKPIHDALLPGGGRHVWIFDTSPAQALVFADALGLELSPECGRGQRPLFGASHHLDEVIAAVVMEAGVCCGRAHPQGRALEAGRSGTCSPIFGTTSSD